MTLISDCWTCDLTLLLVTFFGAVLIFLHKRYQYWANRNVAYSKPTYLFGNMKGVGSKQSFAELMRNLYFEAGDANVYGMWKFITPTLVIKDLQIIKHVMVKDFASFHDRGIMVDTEVNPLSEHLLLLTGSRWKNLRTKLSPTFTSGKMKLMFPVFTACGDQLKTYLNKFTETEHIVDVKSVSSKFSVNIIGSCVFGIDINAFEDPDLKFLTMFDSLLNPKGLQLIKNLILFSIPSLAKNLKFQFFSDEVISFFHGVVKDTMEYREKNNITRNDFLQLLLQLKNLGYVPDVEHPDNKPLDDEKFTTMRAAAASFIFFIAGYETASTTIQYAVYELALHHDKQKKLREEIHRVLAKHKGEVTYEAINEMEYLDRVISETLRKYPPAPVIIRQCTQSYQMPDSDLVIEKGTDIVIPLLGLHYDERYFPKPDVFDPDRFLPENKSQRDHCTYMPFGEGPRICIGMRFGLMQTKVGLITLLRDYEFDVSEKTQIPLKYKSNSNILMPTVPIQLKISKWNK